jgi:hypothetical protein
MSLCLSQAGDGPIFTSSNTRAVKRRQMSGSATSTLAWSSARSSREGAASRAVGSSASGAVVTACSSRATPYTPITSGRFGVTSISITSSAIASASVSGTPGSNPLSSTSTPEWSSPIPSSSSARIIPLEVTPRSSASPSTVPSGMTAPGRATATV